MRKISPASPLPSFLAYRVTFFHSFSCLLSLSFLSFFFFVCFTQKNILPESVWRHSDEIPPKLFLSAEDDKDEQWRLLTSLLNPFPSSSSPLLPSPNSPSPPSKWMRFDDTIKSPGRIFRPWKLFIRCQKEASHSALVLLSVLLISRVIP